MAEALSGDGQAGGNGARDAAPPTGLREVLCHFKLVNECTPRLGT